MTTSYSIVIATIGRPSLEETLNDIAESSSLPSETIIVLPRGSVFSVPKTPLLSNLNVQVLFADKGQVQQRAVGLQQVRSDIVIQLDDDIRFDSLMLEKLINEIKFRVDLAVAPLIFDENQRCRTGVEVRQGKIPKFLLGADPIKGARGEGYISKIGLAVRPNLRHSDALIPSEWLPGGCMAFHKNFITGIGSEFNPEGKFFGEDVINCINLRKKGLSLAFVSDAKVYTQFENRLDPRLIRTHFTSLIFIQKMCFGRPRYIGTLLFCVARLVYQIFRTLRK